MKNPRRAVAGLALGAAGMLYSRLGARRGQRDQLPAEPAPAAPQPERETDPYPQETGASAEELDRARSELSDELARRAANASD